MKKQIDHQKREENSLNEKYKEKDYLYKNLLIKIDKLNRLIREEERREKEPPKNNLITKIE